ncbi:RNA-directed DNA polymerase, eukaryota, reverse transcriptase zinc-binding domain protein [Tanacetum coccineum]
MQYVAMDVQSPLVAQTNSVKTDKGSYPPLPTQGTTPVGNTPGKSSYANVIGKSTISERFVNIAYGFFLGKRVAYLVLNEWFNSMVDNGLWFIRNHPLILSKWNPDVDLLKEDIGNVPVWVKLHGVPVTTFSEDGLNAIATKLGTPLMLDSYTSDMCLQSWDRPVSKKTTASPRDNEKKGVAHTNEVSNSNPFDVLKSVDNNVEFSTNGDTINLVNNEANSTILMDEADNPLKKVECLGDYDSEDEVASVDNDMAHSLASEWTKGTIFNQNNEVVLIAQRRKDVYVIERAIGFAPSGKYWRHLRRIVANHMFSPRSVSSLECLRHHVCDNMIEKVSKEMSEKRIVELRGILQKGSLRNIIESVFGSGLGLRVEEELGFMVKEGS